MNPNPSVIIFWLILIISLVWNFYFILHYLVLFRTGWRVNKNPHRNKQECDRYFWFHDGDSWHALTPNEKRNAKFKAGVNPEDLENL